MRYIIFIIMLMTVNVIASTLTTDEFNRIADAIYRVEGGADTRWPYGVKSIVTTNPRQVCINTISNNFERWDNSSKTNDFIEYLGQHYAPIGAKNDPSNLNINWIRNLKYFLRDNISLCQRLGVIHVCGHKTMPKLQTR